jgi:hypothetical protein
MLSVALAFDTTITCTCTCTRTLLESKRSALLVTIPIGDAQHRENPTANPVNQRSSVLVSTKAEIPTAAQGSSDVRSPWVYVTPVNKLAKSRNLEAPARTGREYSVRSTNIRAYLHVQVLVPVRADIRLGRLSLMGLETQRAASRCSPHAKQHNSTDAAQLLDA